MDNASQEQPFKCTACTRKIKHNHEAKLHPLLGCLICRSCYVNYGTGDFSKMPDGVDENGDDNYCRWCCDGGDLFGCGRTDPLTPDNRCHYNFCRECITRNIGDDPVLKGDNTLWICYACDTSKLTKLRQDAEAAMKVLIKRQNQANQSKDATPKSSSAKQATNNATAAKETQNNLPANSNSSSSSKQTPVVPPKQVTPIPNNQNVSSTTKQNSSSAAKQTASQPTNQGPIPAKSQEIPSTPKQNQPQATKQSESQPSVPKTVAQSKQANSSATKQNSTSATKNISASATKQVPASAPASHQLNASLPAQGIPHPKQTTPMPTKQNMSSSSKHTASSGNKLNSSSSLKPNPPTVTKPIPSASLKPSPNPGPRQNVTPQQKQNQPTTTKQPASTTGSSSDGKSNSNVNLANRSNETSESHRQNLKKPLPLATQEQPTKKPRIPHDAIVKKIQFYGKTNDRCSTEIKTKFAMVLKLYSQPDFQKKPMMQKIVENEIKDLSRVVQEYSGMLEELKKLHQSQ